jgi:hypothetical protein
MTISAPSLPLFLLPSSHDRSPAKLAVIIRLKVVIIGIAKTITATQYLGTCRSVNDSCISLNLT